MRLQGKSCKLHKSPDQSLGDQCIVASFLVFIIIFIYFFLWETKDKKKK